jgi:hypothetical protein
MEIEVNTDYLRKQSLFIGTPLFGGMATAGYLASMLALVSICRDHGIRLHFQGLTNESLIPRARNRITSCFLRTDYTHLLFIDGDISFDPQDVILMLSLDRAIIGGLYPKKELDWERIHRVAKNGAPTADLPALGTAWAANFLTHELQVGDPIEVCHLATGFMLIQRGVFDHMKQALPELKYTPMPLDEAKIYGMNEAWAFFDTSIEPEHRYYLSEDWFFCDNARKLGYKIWAAPWCRTKHIGTFEYTGDMGAFARSGEAV